MIRKSLPIIVAIIAMAVPLTASAQLFTTAKESPRSQMFEIKFGMYTPDIDSESGLSGTPYKTIFGDDGLFMTKFEYDYQLWQGFGSIALGLEVGFGDVTGQGREVDSDTESSDTTVLSVVPMSLMLVYHFDVLATRWDIPLVPFFKAGIDCHIWWINDGVGETSTYETTNAETGKTTSMEAFGDTWGWHVSGGVKLLLDTFAPRMARTFDNDSGVNNSYLFAEVVHSVVDDFGSGNSFQLGDTSYLFGLAFEF